MKIKTCYIENFGKLNKFTYNFQQGLNVIEEENGWGKSTLAAFIKAMFYGLEHTRGKKLTDRKLYSPWNENKFGGYIIFEKEGIDYKIERFFGKTPKYDTIITYNMSRNTETDELGDNPGETIWKVDRDSYEKTAFITLDDSSLLNDIISSKLGNIEDQEADIEASTQAVDLLDKEITRIKAKRGKGGLIGNKEETLNLLKNELRQYKNSLIKLEERDQWVAKEEEELKDIEKKINKIEEKQSKLVLYEKKRQYKDLMDDLKRKESNYKESKIFFKDKVLSQEDLNMIKNESSRYINTKEQGEKIKLSDEKEEELAKLKSKFDESTPSLREIEKYNEKINELSNKKIEIRKYIISAKDEARFLELENKYKDMNLDAETIDMYLDDLNKVSLLIEEENKIKNEIEKLENEKKSHEASKEKTSPNLYVGLGVFVLGVILTRLVFILGLLIGLAGVVLLIKVLTGKSKDTREDNNLDSDGGFERLNKKLDQVQEKRLKLEDGYLSFIESIQENPTNIASFLANTKVDIIEYNRLKSNMEENLGERERLDQDILTLETEIKTYLKKYYDPLEEDHNKALSDLRNDWNSFQNLLELEKSYKETIEEVKGLKKLVEERLLYYYEDLTGDVSTLIQDLTNKYYDLEKSKDRSKEAKENKDKFELENTVGILDKLDPTDQEDKAAIETLVEDKKALNIAYNDLLKEIERYKKDIDTLIQEVDKIEDIESEILKTEEEIQGLNKDHSLLTLTKKCMIDAKENLAEKYMGDMSSNFKKHINKLNTNKEDQYQIDINLDVKVQHGGELYDRNQLSSGMKDLVQLCLRMALVESVYKDGHNPILVLDDPFINLDNHRLKNSLGLLNEINLEYQIIYFICHSSRNLEAIS